MIQFRKVIQDKFKHFRETLPLTSDHLKEKYDDFIEYLNDYLLSENARFPYQDWEQFTSITSDFEGFSRTTNVSESIHSSLNRHFSRRFNFNTIIQKLFEFKTEMISEMAAIEPKRFF